YLPADRRRRGKHAGWKMLVEDQVAGVTGDAQVDAAGRRRDRRTADRDFESTLDRELLRAGRLAEPAHHEMRLRPIAGAARARAGEDRAALSPGRRLRRSLGGAGGRGARGRRRRSGPGPTSRRGGGQSWWDAPRTPRRARTRPEGLPCRRAGGGGVGGGAAQ